MGSVAGGHNPRGFQRAPGGGAGGENGSTGGAVLQRLTGTGSDADVDLGAGGLDDHGGKSLLSVDHGEDCGGAGGVGEEPQGGQGGVTHDRLDLPAERQDPESEAASSVGGAADEGMLLKGHDQSVDDRATDAEGCGQFGDGDPLGGLRHGLQDAQPSVKGLRGLGSHRRSSGDC